MSVARAVWLGTWMALAVGAAGCNGCREEPTIVIKFEPADMTGVAPKSAPARLDAGTAPSVTSDAGAAKK